MDASMPLEVLDGGLVGLRRCARAESAEIAALPRARVLLSRVQAVLTGFQFANHGALDDDSYSRQQGSRNEGLEVHRERLAPHLGPLRRVGYRLRTGIHVA